MKLEQQVPSLDLSKRLKELGVKQESLFYWQGYLYSEEKIELVCKEKLDKEYDFVSAPTVAELGEMLPLYLKKDSDRGISFSVETSGLQTWKNYNNTGWVVAYGGLTSSGNTEANARAKMLVYLLENKLISL